jgi:hypothetical protein
MNLKIIIPVFLILMIAAAATTAGAAGRATNVKGLGVPQIIGLGIIGGIIAYNAG